MQAFRSDDAAGSVADRSARTGRSPRNRCLGDADDSGLLAAADREHLEREIAAIERAAAALRRAEPGLEILERRAAGDDAQAAPDMAA